MTTPLERLKADLERRSTGGWVNAVVKCSDLALALAVIEAAADSTTSRSAEVRIALEDALSALTTEDQT